MASRSGWRRAAVALGVAGTAIVGTLAGQNGRYFTLTLCILLAAWLIATMAAARERPVQSTTSSASPSEDGRSFMLRALLDQAPTPLLVIEASTRVRVLNRSARALFGTDDNLSPARTMALLDPDATRIRHDHRLWRIDRVAAEGLGPPRTLIALVDVEAEQQAAEARATRELLQVLGHEVMNELAPITSLAESALTAAKAGDLRVQLLPDILGTLVRRAEGLRRFSEAYRKMARIPEPELMLESIDEILADLGRLFTAQWQGRVSLTVERPTSLQVLVDREQILQALWALTRNGAEAALAASRPPHVSISVNQANHRRLVLRIEDNGDGIPAEDRSRIFRPFFTNKPGGHGIGLTIARQIALAHGGEIILEGLQPTTFELQIPR